MAKDKNSEFLHNQEYETSDEQFYHADEFNRDVDIGLNKRDSFEADGSEKALNFQKKKKNIFLGKTAATLKAGAITVAAIVAIGASPASVKLGFSKPPLLPENNTVVPDAVVEQPEHDTQGGWITTVSPTCSSDGKIILECANCGELLGEKTLPKLTHSAGEWTTTAAAGCTENGVEVQSCRLCGMEISSRQIDATGHSESGWIVLKAATCTESGTRYTQCTECGTRINSQIIEATGHTAGEWSTAKAASCTSKGREKLYCTVCGIELDSRTTSVKSHSESGWIIDVAKTCTTDGHQYTECTSCHLLMNEETIPASHNEVTVPAVEATCTTDGYTTRIYCDDCGTEIVNSEIIYATGHYEAGLGEYVEATCTTDGSEPGVYCETCGEVFVEQTVVPALGHSWTYEATVNMPANHYCSVCNEVADHTWINNVDDETTHICSDCGNVQSHNFLIYNAEGSVTQRESCPECGTLNPDY